MAKPGHSDRSKIPSDGVPIGSGTLVGDLGTIKFGPLVKWCDLECRFWYINLHFTSELIF